MQAIRGEILDKNKTEELNMKGTVKFYNEAKRFGFITSEEDGNDYFVHETGLNEGVNIKENDVVNFDVVEGDKGPKAENVSMAGAGSDDSAAASDEDDATDDAEE